MLVANCGEDMDVQYFQIVDLGTGPESGVGYGVSHDPRLDSEVLGMGRTAKEAWNDALDQMSIDGLSTTLLNEAGIESGWLGGSANENASDIHEDDEDDVEPAIDEPIFYHVLIRFEDPREEVHS